MDGQRRATAVVVQDEGQCRQVQPIPLDAGRREDEGDGRAGCGRGNRGVSYPVGARCVLGAGALARTLTTILDVGGETCHLDLGQQKARRRNDRQAGLSSGLAGGDS